MKHVYLAIIALSLPLQVFSAETDSVYSWGNWSKGIKPAAGPTARVTPPPAQRPDINFRPNENSAFLREAVQRPNIVTGVSDINTSIPLITSVPPALNPPPPPAP